MRWVRGRRQRQPDPDDGVVEPRSMPPEDLDAFIAQTEQWLQPGLELEPETRAEALRTHGACLRVRYERGGDAHDLKRARASLEAALEASPPNSPLRTRCLSSVGVLGTSLLLRYQQTGRIAELDAAIELLTAAAEAAEPESIASAMQANDLANALVARWRRTQSEADMVAAVLADRDLDRAIELLRDALPAADAEPDLHRAVLGSLGQALTTRSRRAADLRMAAEALADVKDAVSRCEEAIDRCPEQSIARVFAITDLGTALRLRYDLDGDLDILDDAVGHLEEASALGDSLRIGTAPVLSALANALTARIDTPRTVEQDFDSLCSCFRSALAQASADDPRSALDLGLGWGDWAMRRGAWAQAVEAYDASRVLVERLLSGQLVQADRVVTLTLARDVARHASYAAAMAGDLEDAVVRLEQGRGLLIDQELAAGVHHRVTFADIAAAAAPRPLVYLVPTRVGGMGLVVDPDGRVRMLLLPYLASDVLEEHVGPYWGSHRVAAADPDRQVIVVGSQGIEDADPRMRAIDTLCGWMWHAAMRQVVAAVRAAEEVTIIATGGLAIVPLHAAWHPDPSSPSGRRYAADDLTVSYAPSGRVLAKATAPVGDGGSGRLLAVVTPASTQLDPLPGSSIEIDAAAAIAAGVEVLRDARATREAVLEAMTQSRFLLFSTHGFADPDDPMRGGLVLAGDELLTVADVMRERLDGVRLAVLAACETGWSDTHLPDESIGLPSAFLVAGATGVVGSLWRVPSVATAMLIAKFYEHLAAHSSHPAEALRTAQQWLRETTNAEKRAEFPDFLGFSMDADNQKIWDEAHGQANPYFWAGFVFVGR